MSFLCFGTLVVCNPVEELQGRVVFTWFHDTKENQATLLPSAVAIHIGMQLFVPLSTSK